MIRSLKDVLWVLAWSVAIVAAIIAAGVLLGWYFYDYTPRHSYDHLSVADIRRITGVVFPQGSRVLHSTGNSFLSPYLWVQVEMDEHGCRDFIRLLKKNDHMMLSRTTKYRSGGDLDSPDRFKNRHFGWWRKDAVRRFVSARQVRPSSGETTILIDLDKPDSTLVYLYYDH